MINSNTIHESDLERKPLIDGYTIRHILEMLIHNEKVIDRSSAIKCFNELITIATDDAYFTITENMSDLLATARKARS